MEATFAQCHYLIQQHRWVRNNLNTKKSIFSILLKVIPHWPKTEEVDIFHIKGIIISDVKFTASLLIHKRPSRGEWEEGKKTPSWNLGKKQGRDSTGMLIFFCHDSSRGGMHLKPSCNGSYLFAILLNMIRDLNQLALYIALHARFSSWQPSLETNHTVKNGMRDQKLNETSEKLTRIRLFGHLGFSDGTQPAPLSFGCTCWKKTQEIYAIIWYLLV